MCIKNAMELSLNGDTFAALKEDFDSILAQTLSNMESKGADEAVITLKLGVSLEKQSFVRNKEPEELTKPSFKHDISSVMQVKNKKSGSLSGDYELVWDEEEMKYVMRRISNGQMSLFDEQPTDKVEYVKPVMNVVPMLEGASEQDYINVDAVDGSTEKTDPTVFEWLKGFVGTEMQVCEVDGNYTVRTLDNKVILTSASSSDNVFHCDGELLAKHVGHNLACVGYGGEKINNISIECEDCFEVIFSIAFADDVDEESAGDEEADTYGIEDYSDSIYDDLDEDYSYSDPEEFE